MSYYKAVFDFGRAIEEKAPEEREIYRKMSGLPEFGDPPVPYPDLLVAIEEQQVAIDQAQDGSRTRIALMRTKEKVLDNMLRKYRDYVTDVADGNTDTILSSGFRHTKPRTIRTDMEKVTGVKNLYSKISGGLKLRWKRLANVSFYEVDVRQIVPVEPKPMGTGAETGEATEDGAATHDELMLERPWLTKATKPSRIEITGLVPLSKYEVRVRAKGARSYGAYSDVVIIVVT